MPSISKASVGGSEGIRVEILLGSGTVMCDGKGGPSGCRIIAKRAGRFPMLAIFALPFINVYTKK
jgi:hypothetical protein